MKGPGRPCRAPRKGAASRFKFADRRGEPMHSDFLLQSLANRPEVRAQDAIKFLYQNAFGCGHLLPDEAACVQFLREEMEQSEPDASAPAFEPLGNGLCRLNLRSPAVRLLPPERIARMMQGTEAHFNASESLFQDNLQLLREWAARFGADQPPHGSAPRLFFSLAQLEAALAAWEQSRGLPRHSEAYRNACHPAYRVVLRRYGDALPALTTLEEALQARGNAVLALDGDCASGKTTLSGLLAPLYDCNVLHMDDFFLPFALRTPDRLAQPGGNVHYERFRAEVLAGLIAGGPYGFGAFNCHTGETIRQVVQPKPVTIIEGSYALHPAFEADYTSLHAVRALLTSSPAQQRARILRRNGPVLLRRFESEWIPLEKRYFEAYHKTRQDLLILSGATAPEDEPYGEENLP